MAAPAAPQAPLFGASEAPLLFSGAEMAAPAAPLFGANEVAPSSGADEFTWQ